MEPLARIRDWPSATAASPAITPLAERVSASSPENVHADWRAAPSSSCDGGERQQVAVTEDRLLEEWSSAWGEQASSSCSSLQGQWRRAASLGAGKGRRPGGEWRAARTAIFSLRARAAALHGPGAGKLRTPIAQPELRALVEALHTALVKEIEQSQWLALQRAADPLLMSTVLAERQDPYAGRHDAPGARYRQKRRAPRQPEPQPLPSPAPQEMTAATAQWIYRFRGDEGDFVRILAAMDEGGYRLIPSSHQVRDRLAAYLPGAPAGVRLMNVPAAASAPGLPETPT